MADAALGLAVHTGYAHLVAVAIGNDGKLVVLHRARIALWDPPDPEAAQAYHRAAELPLARAEAAIEADRRTAATIAARSLADVAAALAAADHRAVATRIVDKPRTALPALPTILAAHPLLHAAEGELYRAVAATAAAALAPDVGIVHAARLPAVARTTLGLTPARLASQLAAAGRAVGSPWTAEHKDCALAAWIALADRARS